MPKYFHSKTEQLHCEAYASLLLINERIQNNPNEFRLYSLQQKAQARVYRRWLACEVK